MKDAPSEQLASRETGQPSGYYDLFAEVSGAEPAKAVKTAQEFFIDLPPLPPDAFESAKLIRNFLIGKGFSYADGVFCLPDMIANKRGNCLGLSLLIGAELRSKGFNPGYQIILHPHDAIDKQDQRLFTELYRGEHFDYDAPQLADEQAEYPTYRFAPLEHPSLILGEHRFETTGLDDASEDPGWSPDAELIRPAGFKEVASNVYVDRAKTMINSGKFEPKVLRELSLQAVRMWPDNREAWSLVFDVAQEIQDGNLVEQAKARYLEIGGDDSRFYYTCYKMTGDQKYLDLALNKFPAYVEPFVVKNVNLQTDDKEARFNLAVASWCAANSSAFNLKRFYQLHAGQVTRLYGARQLKTLLRKL